MALVDLIMPKLGESIMEATILRWTKKPGEKVEQDETVLEIATDKVDSEVPSTAAGTLTEILFNENDVVPIGTVIARIETGEQSAAGNAAQATPTPANSPNTTNQQENLPPDIPYVPQDANSTFETEGNNNGFFSPLVLNIAKAKGYP